METKNKSFCNIMKSVGISLLSTIVFLLIFSAMLAYTNISEQVIKTVVIVVLAISILIGSSIGNNKIKKNGLINGAFIGFTYMIIIHLVSSILNSDFGLSLYSVIFIISGVVFGIVGGIIGINKK